MLGLNKTSVNYHTACFWSLTNYKQLYLICTLTASLKEVRQVYLLSPQQTHAAFGMFSECSPNYCYSSPIQLNCLNPSLSKMLKEIPDPELCRHVCSDNYLNPFRSFTYTCISITQNVFHTATLWHGLCHSSAASFITFR